MVVVRLGCVYVYSGEPKIWPDMHQSLFYFWADNITTYQYRFSSLKI